MPKKTCHGRRVDLLFLEPPGYQKVAKPTAHCPEEVIEKLIYALLCIVIRILQNNRKRHRIQQKK